MGVSNHLQVILLICVVYFSTTIALPKNIQIGALFDETSTIKESVFNQSLDEINEGKYFANSKFMSIVKITPPNDSYFASKQVCQMLKNGVAAVLAPSSLATAPHIQSICDAVGIPYIETHCNSRFQRTKNSLNIHPHPSSLSKAYYDIVRDLNWTSLAILYEDGDSLKRLQNLLNILTVPGHKVSVRKLPRTKNFRSIIKDLEREGERHIVLDCSIETLTIFLKQAQQVGVINSEYSFFVTNLDFHTVDLEDYQHSGAKIIGLGLVDTNKISATGLTLPSVLTTEIALMYDAVQLIAKGLSELDKTHDFRIRPLSCEGTETWLYGPTLVDIMAEVEMEGLSGLIKFDSEGYRKFFQLSVLELGVQGLRDVGIWNPTDGGNFTLEPSEPADGVINDKKLIVSSILSEPYFMLKESSETLEGNDRFEGFAVDVIDEISKLIGFKYVFQMVGDGKYGALDATTGKWNGIIGELLQGKADLGIADLSVSYQREKAVDFTLPFMNTGISILYKKPTKQSPSLFWFLSPFSFEVWIYILAAYIGISIVLFIVARLTESEWSNPHPCDPNSKVLENKFNFLNSAWFTISSMMQQGYDIVPKATLTRMVASIWWFFTIIIISSYIANLAAFLTVDRFESPISSVEDLASQTNIKYGSVGSGSTTAFLRDTNMEPYNQMWQFMESENQSSTPGPFTKNVMEGVKRVQDSNGFYAFLMESSTIEYFIERKCDLTQIGGMLDSKGYGIATKKGSPHSAVLNQAVLKLHETNRLLVLKRKWWQEKRGGGACKDDEAENGSTSASSELGLVNVGGVFLVLIAGLGIAFVLSFFEFLWASHKKISEGESNSWSSAFRELGKTIVSSQNTKRA